MSIAISPDNPDDFNPVCINCGTTKDLEFAPDPFTEEIYNDPTPVWECEKCRYESAQDI